MVKKPNNRGRNHQQGAPRNHQPSPHSRSVETAESGDPTSERDSKTGERGAVGSFLEKLPDIIIACATVALAIFAYKAWDESTKGTRAIQGQLDAAQGQLAEMKSENRPWVMLDNGIVTPTALTFDQSGAHVAIVGKLRNGGRSIAKNIQTITSRLLIQPVIPENTFVNASQFTTFLGRGLGRDVCGTESARGKTAFGGGLLLPDGMEEWHPGSDGLMQTPRNEFVFDSMGKVSVWMDLCVMYRDETDAAHTTALALLFVSEGSNDVAPAGEAKGNFSVYVLNAN